MPAPAGGFVIQNKIVFEDRANGWTEKYFTVRPTNDLGAAMADLLAICGKRALLLGSDSFIKGQSCSVEWDTAGQYVLNDAKPERFKFQGPVVLGGSPPADINGSAKPGVSLNLIWTNINSTRWRRMSMGGIPDGLEGPSGDPNLGWAQWLSSFQSWRAALFGIQPQNPPTIPVGWVGVDKAKKHEATIIDYVVDVTSNNIIFSLDSPIFNIANPPNPPLAPLDKPIVVIIKGLNGRSSLNGEMRVVPITSTSCRTFMPVATVPFVSKGKMRWSEVQFNAAAFCDTEQIMYKKRGRGLLQPRGRATNRLRA